jgi:hypothetical protein
MKTYSMNADSNEAERDRRALAISVWENEGGRERRTRRMVNAVAASKWFDPQRTRKSCRDAWTSWWSGGDSNL